MKKAKKIITVFAILLALVLGTAKIVVAIISLNEPSPSSEVKEPIQLTHSSEYEDGEFVQTKQLKTEEGIENCILKEKISKFIMLFLRLQENNPEIFSLDYFFIYYLLLI